MFAMKQQTLSLLDALGVHLPASGDLTVRSPIDGGVLAQQTVMLRHSRLLRTTTIRLPRRTRRPARCRRAKTSPLSATQ